MKLFKGRATIAGMTSPKSLYSNALASFTMGAEYNPTDATGFIRLFGLQMKVARLVNKISTKSKK
jgi:argininosuccinate synthase